MWITNDDMGWGVGGGVGQTKELLILCMCVCGGEPNDDVIISSFRLIYTSILA